MNNNPGTTGTEIFSPSRAKSGRFLYRGAWIIEIMVASAVAAIAMFCFYRVSVDTTGADGTVTTVSRPAGITLWQLFGTTNQLLASLTLLLATRYLARRGRYAWVTGAPMVFMVVSTSIAMVSNLRDFLANGQTLLVVVGSILLVLAVWLAFEGVAAMRRDRRAADA